MNFPGPIPLRAPEACHGQVVVRPGLILAWSERIAPAAPPDAIAGIRYWLGEDATPTMRAVRTDETPPTENDASRFHAAVFFSRAAALELLAGDASAGACALRDYADNGAVGFSHALTPHARLALESIRRCPFAGVCRAMALTARCHDLLVEFLSAWSAALAPTPPVIGPNDRVRLAAELLERELEAPPSLASLAAKVGLSETSLKRGFPQVFGTTVYGYVRRRRMEKARQLLERGAATVLEAAMLVGYSNPSNFAAAFRREFGVNPKTFQLRARNPA